MGAKTTTKLVLASIVAGGVIAPPVVRATKRRAVKGLRRGAKGYISAREFVTSVGEATGRPGHFAALAAGLTVQAAKEANDRWWALVTDVEKEQAEPKPEDRAVESPTTIEEYIGSPS